VDRALFSVPESEDEPDASRGAILDGALAAFLDVGVRRTSMGDVARRSRISPATLYRKFAGKSGLVEAVALREVRRFLADMDDTLEATRRAGGDAEEQVITLGLSVIDWIRRNRLLRRLLETEPELVLPLLTTQGTPVLTLGRTYLRGVLERLQREGVLPKYDPDPIAETLARLALSLALTPESVLPLDDDDAARALFRAHIVPALGLQGRPAATRRSPR
jgi:AcrR family transcriptional regulator